jgi:hypothetical protein
MKCVRRIGSYKLSDYKQNGYETYRSAHVMLCICNVFQSAVFIKSVRENMFIQFFFVYIMHVADV